MEEPILSMARAVKETPDDTQIMKSAQPGFIGYVGALAQAVQQITKQLGPGWAKPKSLGMAETDSSVPSPASPAAGRRKSKR